MGDGVALNHNIRDGGAFGKFFCSARHPDLVDEWCRRLQGHDGQHAAFVHRVSEPERW